VDSGPVKPAAIFPTAESMPIVYGNRPIPHHHFLHFFMDCTGGTALFAENAGIPGMG